MNEELPSFPDLEVLEELAPGVGGMGKVYRARDKNLERIVAVKTTRSYLRTEEGKQFFAREARSVACLDHPGIIKIHSFHPDHDPPYYVMQYVEGRPLDQACAGRDLKFAATVVARAARALGYAHSFGILHRDIKPANILVDYHGEPHIADFGLAKGSPPGRSQHAVELSSPRGTPAYMAPEVLLDEEVVTQAIDIYALGVTLYLLVSGSLPFPARSYDELRESVLEGVAPLPLEINPNCPEPLQRICLKAMERDAEARYETADSMADDLQRFIDGREVFARPRRYFVELEGKLRNHITDVQLWRAQNLIGLRETDRILRPYRLLLSADRSLEEHSRRFPWESILLRLGGWLVLVSSILWPFFYWDRLDSHERVLAFGIPTVLLNTVGWLYHWRKSRVNSVPFLSIGALLVPLFLATLLGEYGLLHYPQDASRELFGRDALQAVGNSSVDAAVGARPFAPCNTQIVACAAVFFGYSVSLLLASGARVFVFLAGLGLHGLYVSCFLLGGIREWLEKEKVAWAILSFIPLALVFLPLSLTLERRRRVMWSSTFYCFFPPVFVVLLTLLAFYGGDEWLGADRRNWRDAQAIQLWFITNGLLYLGIAIASARSPISFVRFWGGFFFLVVPISLLIPVNLLFHRGLEIVKLGDRFVTTYEILALLLCVTIIALGTKLRRANLSVPGLIGLAVWLFRVTHEHFKEHLGWPLVLAIFGGTLMVVAVALNLVRVSRARKDVVGSPPSQTGGETVRL